MPVLAERSSVVIIVCFDSKFVEKSRANSEGSLSILVLLNHPGDKALEAIVNGVRLPDGDVVDPKVPIHFLLGQFFKLDHLIVVYTTS